MGKFDSVDEFRAAYSDQIAALPPSMAANMNNILALLQGAPAPKEKAEPEPEPDPAGTSIEQQVQDMIDQIVQHLENVADEVNARDKDYNNLVPANAADVLNTVKADLVAVAEKGVIRAWIGLFLLGNKWIEISTNRGETVSRGEFFAADQDYAQGALGSLFRMYNKDRMPEAKQEVIKYIKDWAAYVQKWNQIGFGLKYPHLPDYVVRKWYETPRIGEVFAVPSTVMTGGFNKYKEVRWWAVNLMQTGTSSFWQGRRFGSVQTGQGTDEIEGFNNRSGNSEELMSAEDWKSYKNQNPQTPYVGYAIPLTKTAQNAALEFWQDIFWPAEKDVEGNAPYACKDYTAGWDMKAGFDYSEFIYDGDKDVVAAFMDLMTKAMANVEPFPAPEKGENIYSYLAKAYQQLGFAGKWVETPEPDKGLEEPGDAEKDDPIDDELQQMLDDLANDPNLDDIFE